MTVVPLRFIHCHFFLQGFNSSFMALDNDFQLTDVIQDILEINSLKRAKYYTKLGGNIYFEISILVKHKIDPLFAIGKVIVAEDMWDMIC